MRSLVDSGSSHCFIDTSFIRKYNLHVTSVPSTSLELFDGSFGTPISESVDLTVHFPSGEVTPMSFYVTKLDPECPVVLGHNWLTRYNPLIDWVKNHISFQTLDVLVRDPAAEPPSPTLFDSPKDTHPPLVTPVTPVPPSPSPSPEPSFGDKKPPCISLINAVAFARVARMQGTTTYRIFLSDTGTFDPPTSDDSVDLSKLPEEYHEYADVFSKTRASKLAEHRPYDLKINLEEGASPPIGTMYSLSQVELETLRKFIDESLSMGFIRPTRSSHGAPVVFAKKKDGTLRVCVDFRGLNKITKKDRYPLPLISDLLDTSQKGRIYTKIDLRHAYHLVRIAEGEEWKTAFRTRWGSYEWCVIPEGLTNAPATFQRFMNDIFADMLDVCVIVYLNDVLVYSENPEVHREHVKEVLRRLRKAKLYAKIEKCTFSADTVEYLGYILSPSGLTMDPDKVKVITDWPEPRKVRDVQSFLGFANFYRRLIYNYSEIALPLVCLTRKAVRWNFSSECRQSFEALKEAFTRAPILSHWIPNAQITVETDASDYAIAAILSITHSDQQIHPIAFLSRTLNPSELNYDTHDKELLAIFEAFRVWRHYLEGSTFPVDVVTDHKNLEYFSSTKLLTRRQARWSEYLSPFNFVLRFRPGKLGAKPDSLTRRWDVYPKEGDSGYANANPHNYKPVFTQEQLAASLRATYFATPVLRAATIMDVNQLLTDIKEATSKDQYCRDIISSIDSNPRWAYADGLLFRDGKIWVPEAKDLYLRILQDKHDHVLAGHFGFNKTLDLIRRQFAWPNMRTFIHEYCKTCTTCPRSKATRHRPYGLLKQLSILEKPWNSISMDFIEQLPSSEGHTAILVIVDRLSKQAIFIPSDDAVTAVDLAQLFVLHVFSKHGVPSHVTSDRGSEFVSHFFRSLGKALDMNLHFTSGYHPEGDGQTERMNQTLEQYLRIYCNYQQDNWAPLLPLAEFAYNNAPNATTGITPFFANKGYHPNISVSLHQELTSSQARKFVVDLEQLHSELRQAIKISQQRYQVSADARLNPAPDFKVGDQVFVLAKFMKTTRPSKKLSEKYLGPYEIIAQPGTHSFTLRLPESMRAIHPVYHVSMLEPAHPNTIPNCIQPPPPPVKIEGDLEYEIDEILDSKIDKRRKCKLLYLVRWTGYEHTNEDQSWLLAMELHHASEAVSKFHN